MKIYIRKFITLLCAAGLFSACGKSLLETEPTGVYSSKKLSELSKIDPKFLNYSLDGIYSLMYRSLSGGTTTHMDFGQKGVDIITDLMSTSMTMSHNQYNQYLFIVNYAAVLSNRSTQGNMIWTYYYKVIYSVNELLDNFSSEEMANPMSMNAERRHVLGQALAIRANAYYNLCQIYAPEYSENEELIPLYTSLSEAKGRSTQKELYDKMAEDLNLSIELLKDYKRTSKLRINSYVAKGILSYVYAAQGKYTEVQQLTEDIIANGGFSLTSRNELIGGFNNVRTQSWMWAAEISLSDGLALPSFWGQMDIYSFSYASVGDYKVINKELFNEIKSDDIRRSQFDAKDLIPSNKFYSPEKVIGGTNNVTQNDLLFMRVDEFYLLNAEAQLATRGLNASKSELKRFLATRIGDTSYLNDINSAEDMKKELFSQWRIEMWGEGKSLSAIRRLKQSVTVGSNCYIDAIKGKKFDYNSESLFFKVPQIEIDNNPYIR